MHAVVVDQPGGPEALTWREVPDPELQAGEVLVDVAATACNRADVAQRQGNYPPPPGASPYLGLECSGRIAALGPEVAEPWQIGDEVCALLRGGGYAERVTVPAGELLPVPAGTGLAEAAALPEAACTVWYNVFMQAGLQPGESLLVHGGGSGIGTFAIQLAHAWGASVLATAGSSGKLAVCRELGAQTAINYREEDFPSRVREATDGRGVDVILDIQGASYLDGNLRSLAEGGRLMVIGLMGGRTAELDLGRMLAKRLSVRSARLRALSRDARAQLVASVARNVWPLVESGAIRPIVDRRVPLAGAAEAHRVLESSAHTGKVLLTV